MMILAFLVGIKPERKKEGPLYEIGKIFAEYFSVEIINHRNGNLKELYEIFNFKGYTKIKPYNNLIIILRQFINLKRYCKKEKAHILISLYNTGFEGPFVTIFAKIYKKKSIVRFAGDPFNTYKYTNNIIRKIITFILINLITLKILKKADKIITLSESLKNQLIKNGYDEKKINVIMQPMDYQKFKLNNKKNPNIKIKNNKINALYVGKLTKYKGLDTILFLLKNKKIQEKYHFLIAGRDTKRYKYKLKKFPNVTYLGYIPKEKLIEYYHSVDLLIHPSYTEGFPKVVTEAYACRCPIVARNIVNLDRLAYYVFNNDKEILDILINKEFKRINKVTFPEEFQYDIIKEKYLNLINEIIQIKNKN